MKQNNNLIRISNILTKEVRYFTKNSYVCQYIGCSNTALSGVIGGNSPRYQNWKYEIVDGSNIKYKDINIIF